MASLIKQSGRYYLQFYSSSRRPKQKKVALRTTRKSAAQTKRRELEDAYVEGRFDPWTDDPFAYEEAAPEPLPIGEALERFLDAKEKAGRSESTIISYRKVIRRIARRVGVQTPLDRLTAHDIDAEVWAAGIAQATRDRRYRHVSAFLNWCLSQGFCKQSVLEEVETPRRPSKMPKHVTRDELERICATIRRDWKQKLCEGKIVDGEVIWLEAAFRFAYFSGLRGSELARLKWRHIDLQRSLIFIYQQKNGKEQTVPLLEKARDALTLAPSGEPDDYVFRSPRSNEKRCARFYRSYLSRRFTLYRKKAGITRKVTLHGLRHGFATALAEAGKSAPIIQAACRHADLGTTMKYIHLANEHLKTELDGVF